MKSITHMGPYAVEILRVHLSDDKRVVEAVEFRVFKYGLRPQLVVIGLPPIGGTATATMGKYTASCVCGKYLCPHVAAAGQVFANQGFYQRSA